MGRGLHGGFVQGPWRGLPPTEKKRGRFFSTPPQGGVICVARPVVARLRRGNEEGGAAFKGVLCKGLAWPTPHREKARTLFLDSPSRGE